VQENNVADFLPQRAERVDYGVSELPPDSSLGYKD
jgi:hypothetical protein